MNQIQSFIAYWQASPNISPDGWLYPIQSTNSAIQSWLADSTALLLIMVLIEYTAIHYISKLINPRQPSPEETP